MGLRRHRVRTDRTSTLIQSSTSPSASPNIKWSTLSMDMRGFTHLAVFFNPTLLSSVSFFEVFFQWSDDLTTIPFDATSNIQQTDFNQANFSDGSFNPKSYSSYMSISRGTLVTNRKVVYRLPVNGRYVRVGVMGAGTAGLYDIRAQRLVA